MENKDFSRSKMTAWICGTVAVAALAVVWAISSQPEPIDPFDRYPMCKGADREPGSECRAEAARQRIKAM